MKLITKEIERRAPALYSQEKVSDPVPVAKFFTPWTYWTWYMLEYDPSQRLAFGYVEGHDRELGYFSIDELESIRGPFGLKVERDLYWKPQPMSVIKRR